MTSQDTPAPDPVGPQPLTSATPSRGRARRVLRWSSPTVLVVAALLFVLPFLTVSCAPGGYGRGANNATTGYSGVDLMIGGTPKVTGDLRPEVARSPDKLGPQPLIALALVVIVAGAFAVRLQPTRRRRRVTALAALGAALLLTAGEAAARIQVVDRVRHELPNDPKAATYVGVALGFQLCALLLIIVIVTNLIGLLPWARKRMVETMGG